MPGPISDSYDPEFGTGENCAKIVEAIDDVYGRVSRVLGNSQPMYILDIVQSKRMSRAITATLTEKQWRIIRFALERAKDSI